MPLKSQKIRHSARNHPPARRSTRAKAHISSRPRTREPLQERARETSGAIVTAAGQLLVEIGYAKITTNAIAARAGVSIGSLYQYFRNKDEVLQALMRRHFERIDPLLDAFRIAVAHPGSDIPVEIGKFVDALVLVHEPERDLIRAIDQELGWLQARDSTSAKVHESWANHVAQLLGARRPKVPDPLATAHLLVAAVGFTSRWLAHSAPPGIERSLLTRGVVRMIRGLLYG